MKKHSGVTPPPPPGDCTDHPDQCPDPIYGIPVGAPIQNPKLPTPIEVVLPTPDGIEAGSEELGVGDLTTEASSTPEVSIQTVDSLSTDNLQLETDTTSTPPVLTVDPVEPLPIVSFEAPQPEADATTIPEIVATSTDPIVLPDPVLIEPLATSTDETSTTTALTINPDATPNAAPASGDVVTYYIDKYYEKQWNGVARNHYFLGTINLALDVLSGTNTGVYYVLSDHLGSSSLTTNSFGNMIDRTEYAPYGSIVATAATQNIGNNYKFTGKEADAENNLQYFGARYYDNRVGKFTQIDPITFDPNHLIRTLADPQSLNGYSYARNNPVILVDPDGNFLHIIAGAALGAVISAGMTYWQTGDVKQAASAAVGGAITGGLIAAIGPAGLIASVEVGAGTSIVGGSATRLLNGQSLSLETVADDSTAGAIGGAVGHGLGKAITSSLSRQASQQASKAVTTSAAESTEVIHLNGPIKITPSRFQHVIDRHTMNGVAASGTSIFNEGENITALIQRGTQQAKQLGTNGYYERLYDVGKKIGIDPNGSATSWIRLITDKNDNLITIYPVTNN